MIPWERFRASVAEAETLARPEDFDSYERLGEHYAAMRRWAPASVSPRMALVMVPLSSLGLWAAIWLVVTSLRLVLAD